MNKYDSSLIASLLEKEGWKKVDNWKDADIVLVNTCAVREHAEARVFSRLGIWGKYKETVKPDLKIGILGCISQKEAGNLFHRFPYLDLVAGTFALEDIPRLIKDTEKGKVVALEEKEEDIPLVERKIEEVTTFVSIMRGCNNFCSYCIVPYVRGRERSRKVENIVKEIEYLVERGVKEITLLGQNVNSYRGYWEKERECIDFPQLLRIINEIPGIERIRFATSHPKDLSDSLIEAVRDLEKVCEHIHLPVQSGSNKILNLMNRRYTREDYLNLIEKIRKKIPHVAISTDIIVGFPGEGEKEFQETLSLLKEIEFDSAFIFKYSPRPLTRAFHLKDDVPREEKERRLNLLLSLQKEISQRKAEKFVGKEVEVLVERKEKDKWFGKTRDNRSVLIDCEINIRGKIIPVKIYRNRKGILEGKYKGG